MELLLLGGIENSQIKETLGEKSFPVEFAVIKLNIFPSDEFVHTIFLSDLLFL